jgi:hypothetical protein
MRQTIPISKDFFCDGSSYLLTSSSLGGSGLTAEEMQDIIFEESNEKTTRRLLEKGVCIPIFFPGDCALDGETEFVLGDLTEREEQAWQARFVWKLNIPCGKLILCCGCLAEDLEPALAGEKPDPHYTIYQVIDVPPDEYKVEIYAYDGSQTVRVALDNDETGDGAGYVIRLTPLGGEALGVPEIEGGWFHKFEFRDAPENHEIE